MEVHAVQVHRNTLAQRPAYGQRCKMIARLWVYKRCQEWHLPRGSESSTGHQYVNKTFDEKGNGKTCGQCVGWSVDLFWLHATQERVRKTNYAFRFPYLIVTTSGVSQVSNCASDHLIYRERQKRKRNSMSTISYNVSCHNGHREKEKKRRLKILLSTGQMS